jgi:hypothetical protein
MKHWLSELTDELQCDSRFASELWSQLTNDFIKRTAIDPTDGNYGIVPTSDDYITYDDQGVGSVETDLITPDGWTREVTFSWKCGNHSGERIDHSAALPDGCAPVFWWSGLPAEKLTQLYGKPVGPPWLREEARSIGYSPATYSFAIEWWALAWPFVFFQIDAGRALPDSDIDTIGDAIAQMQTDWNEDESHGLIHNIHEPIRLTQQSCQGYIDFGSAGKGAVVRLLDTLQMLTSTIQISKVTFKPSGN